MEPEDHSDEFDCCQSSSGSRETCRFAEEFTARRRRPSFEGRKMHVTARFGLMLLRAAPTVLIIGFVVFLLFNDTGGQDERAAELAVFVDYNEAGDISVLKFDGNIPDPATLPRLGSLRILHVENTTITDQLIQAITEIPTLKAVSFAGSTVRDEQLQRLRELPALTTVNLSRIEDHSEAVLSLATLKLKTLRLNDCPWVDDNFLADISAFSTLEWLVLSNANITDEGTKCLAQLPNLQGLVLSGCDNLSDGTLSHLENSKILRSLAMPSKHLTVAAAFHFQQVLPLVYLSTPLTDFPELRRLLSLDERYTDEKRLQAFGTNFRDGIKDLYLEDSFGADYTPLQFFPRIQRLSLRGPGVNDQAIGYLGGMHQLKSLDLTGAKITDSGIQGLPQLAELSYLELQGTTITDSGLQKLKQMTNLRILSLCKTAITDAGLKHVSGLTHLQSLNLKDTEITDVGLASLSDLTNIYSLDLRGTAISIAGLQHLNRLKSLSELRLPDSIFADAEPEELAKLPTLVDHLDLSGSRITASGLGLLEGKPYVSMKLNDLQFDDTDLMVVRTWSDLHYLDLSGLKVTGTGLRLPPSGKLRTLIMDRTDVRDETLLELEFPHFLQNFSLCSTSIQGETLTIFSDLELESLELSHTPLSRQGVVNAFALDLRRLDLTGVKVDVEDALPELLVGRNSLHLTVDAESSILRALPATNAAGRLQAIEVHGANSSHLTLLGNLQALSSVRLVAGTFKRNSFSRMSDLPRLRELILIDCRLSTDAIDEISYISELEYLILLSSPVAAENLKRLGTMNKDLQVSISERTEQ